MRQTLLGWKMTSACEYNCDEYIHLHVIPAGNTILRNTITSPALQGSSMSDAWQRLLRSPERYRVLSPWQLLQPLANVTNQLPLLGFLHRRYWSARPQPSSATGLHHCKCGNAADAAAQPASQTAAAALRSHLPQMQSHGRSL